jgi:AbrB family looped-hinge helix DNA binding protein
MTAITLSSKGQLVLPAQVRQRFGLTSGSQLELVEESDGIRLVVAHGTPTVSVESGFGMFKLGSKGGQRRLDSFDAAKQLAQTMRAPKQS